MPNDDPFSKAQLLFDQNDFSAARETILNASLVQEPKDIDLSNLFTIEKSEKLLFYRKLHQLYPNSLHIQRVVANYEANEGQFKLAISIYQEILQSDNLDDNEKARVRFERLSANCKRSATDPALLVSDFLYLWNLMAKNGKPLFPAMRRNLIRILFSQANNMDFVPLLMEIADHPTLDPNIQRLLMGQVELIKQFDLVSASL